jgi:phosphomannomutase / phosphoglucomutase
LVSLQKAVKENRADFGIAYDGDGDRLGVVMENGKIMQIEHLMLLYIKDMIGSVQNKRFLCDIKCSKVLDDMISRWGGEVVCYRTGASYTQYKVHVDNLPFGGEYSGHLFFRDKDADCGSAIYASLRLLEILSKTNEKLSKMVKDFPVYYTTPEIKIPCSDSLKFLIVEEIKKYAKSMNYPINDIDGVRITYLNGWALVRASNTGPNVTFRAEATSEAGILSLKNIYLPMIENFNKPIDTL